MNNEWNRSSAKAMAEEGVVVELDGLENEEEEEVEGVDYSQPMIGPGEINEGMPALWLSAEEAADEDIEPKDLSEFAVQVSVEFLDSLGLSKYSTAVENNNLGIESLLNMSFDVLGEFIPDPSDRALILGRADKTFVRSSAPRVDGRPVRVQAKFGIARISEINTVDLTARIKLFIDLYWHDPRLIGARSDQVPNYIWIPDCYVYNCELCDWSLRYFYNMAAFLNSRYSKKWRERRQTERASSLSSGFIYRPIAESVGS